MSGHTADSTRPSGETKAQDHCPKAGFSSMWSSYSINLKQAYKTDEGSIPEEIRNRTIDIETLCSSG